MLKKTRVSSTPDFGRIANAVSRPGIDPRIWASLAVVRAVTVDPAEGVFADVTLLPSQLESTARLGTEYAGSGFGAYFPLRVGDEVVVSLPSGDPAEGMVISKRVWSPSDPPPQDAINHPADVALTVQPGQSMRFLLSDGGTFAVTAPTTNVVGDVNLGSAAAYDALVKGTTYRAAEDVLLNALITYINAIQPFADPPGNATTTMRKAIQDFQSGAATYLSILSRTG